MMNIAKKPHWLDQYRSKDYQWRSLEERGRPVFYRPLGLVEFTFDADGRYFEGRADMNAQLDLDVRCSLSNEDFRERVLFAWTCLRCQHLLLQAKAVPTKHFYGTETVAGSNICFAVDAPQTVTQAIEDAGFHLVFLSDHFDNVDPLDFWVHCQNTARIIDPDRALSRLFVYGLEANEHGRSVLRFLKIGAHEIEDGLTSYTWMRDFIGFLNQPVSELRDNLRGLIEPDALFKRLPLPQEALYPAIWGSSARQRWFWLLSRILRHVRRPLQAGFLNPLRRRNPRREAIPLSPTYAPVLDYSKTPPLNSIPCFGKVSTRGTQRLHRLCREVKGSIGAGTFALVALILMEMYEQREPDVPLAKRRPFISGFPLNPRAFFNHDVAPNSLMLAFCDGIYLPFLPSDLPLDARLRLLIRQAHRQLAAYQKRANRNSDKIDLQYMGSRGAGRVLATQYVSSIERMHSMLPPHFSRSLNPQGAYPMRPNASLQTCGVSSVGSREKMIRKGVYDLEGEGNGFVADYRSIYATVRPRDDEFLVGCGGDWDGLWINNSIDGNAVDPEMVQQWQRKFESILDEADIEKTSKL